jgi:hypothetical protein
MPPHVISGISSGFPGLSQSQGQVAHVLLTRSPLIDPRRGFTVRLACVKHAAKLSVDVELMPRKRSITSLESAPKGQILALSRCLVLHLSLPKESVTSHIEDRNGPDATRAGLFWHRLLARC